MKVKSNKTFQVNVEIDTVGLFSTTLNKLWFVFRELNLTEALDENHFKGNVTIKFRRVTKKI